MREPGTPSDPKVTPFKPGGKQPPRSKPDAAGTAGSQTAALLRIVQLEADLRRSATVEELIYHLANESRSVLGFRQAFVLRHRARARVAAISSVPNFDANAPLTRWIEGLATDVLKDGRAAKSFRFRVSEFAQGAGQEAMNYGFPNFIWMPLKSRRGRVFASVLIARERDWPEDSLPLADRLSEAYAHAWTALAGRSVDRRWPRLRSVAIPALIAALLAMTFVKAPLTALAPVEVTGKNAALVTAPLDGVIDSLLIQPNQQVEAGQVIARLEDTDLKAALDISAQAVIVAETRLAQLQQGAFLDPDAARQVPIAEAERDLAVVERDQAASRLERTEIRALRSGVAVIDDTSAWTGRPVQIGERILEIADPALLEFSISLAIDDNIVLEEGAFVKIFLDRDPLSPIEAKLVRGAYQASAGEDGTLAFALTADATGDTQADLRIGARGTAQVFGAEHRLGFILLRRPISWLRQRVGL